MSCQEKDVVRTKMKNTKCQSKQYVCACGTHLKRATPSRIQKHIETDNHKKSLKRKQNFTNVYQSRRKAPRKTRIDKKPPYVCECGTTLQICSPRDISAHKVTISHNQKMCQIHAPLLTQKERIERYNQKRQIEERDFAEKLIRKSRADRSTKGK